MVIGIVEGDEKTEMGQNGINGFFRRSGGRRQLLMTGGGAWQLGESTPVSGRPGRWLGGGPAAFDGGAAERDPREEREREFRGEREKKRGDWPFHSSLIPCNNDDDVLCCTSHCVSKRAVG
ncbi:hypothetical protein PanWU01x14_076070 [Parasponia andersonii]|uniref:Uncharacterized protein n=1 Tax=Parasponia andersonii TaxID=3476 RepID=A0A2P5DCZ6_PARAD|nr:hypothetical protein PanWU01x14_076070 [Parasponia andersonii]